MTLPDTLPVPVSYIQSIELHKNYSDYIERNKLVVPFVIFFSRREKKNMRDELNVTNFNKNTFEIVNKTKYFDLTQINCSVLKEIGSNRIVKKGGNTK